MPDSAAPSSSAPTHVIVRRRDVAIRKRHTHATNPTSARPARTSPPNLARAARIRQSRMSDALKKKFRVVPFVVHCSIVVTITVKSLVIHLESVNRVIRCAGNQRSSGKSTRRIVICVY
jgi:hypothetical protein